MIAAFHRRFDVESEPIATDRGHGTHAAGVAIDDVRIESAYGNITAIDRDNPVSRFGPTLALPRTS